MFHNPGTGPCLRSTSAPVPRTTRASSGKTSPTHTLRTNQTPTGKFLPFSVSLSYRSNNHNRWSPNDTAPWELAEHGARSGNPSTDQIPESESCVNVNVTGYSCGPAISRDRYEPLSFPGRLVNFTWDNPGLPVGPNNSYVTSTQAGEPAFVAWVGQLNVTFTPLTITGNNSGYSWQPPNEVFETDPAINGTVFVALTDTDLYVTPFNLTLLNPHVRALGIYESG